jgi:hypothetical protein
MAFCPHCGKAVGEQASRCAACEGELESRGKPARFKGTMMMSPGTAPLIAPPKAAAPAPAASLAATAPMPAPTPAALPVAPAESVHKPALKATMLGTGDGGLAAIGKNLGGQPPTAATPVVAPAPVAPAPIARPVPAPEPEPEPEPARAAAPQLDAAEDDSKRFLVGDPMAPSHGGKAQSRHVSRLSQEIPRDRSGMWIAVGLLGVGVIAGLGYVAAKLMGLAD